MNSQHLYTANTCCLFIVLSVLLGAFGFQYGLGENPCPLCLLQRMGMLGVVIGLAFNTQFGFHRRHFALVIFAALVGCTFSMRQVLLHVCPEPGQPTGYGTPILGMHLYSWGVLIFAASILGSACFLLFAQDAAEGEERTASLFEKVGFYAASGICLANAISTFIMCNVGPCCENGPCP